MTNYTQMGKNNAMNAANSPENVISIYQANTSYHAQDRFDKAVREKLMTFKPTPEQIEKWAALLPDRPTYTNLVVVPDLSNRILQPNRLTQDTVLLHQLWDVFKEKVRNSKPIRGERGTTDKFMVDITDAQAIQGFSAYADSLIVNHADNKKMKASVYNIQREGITKFFEKLYQDGLKKTKGADYVYYINEILPHRIIAPDLFRNYRNCFVFITDGYLAIQNNHEQETWTDYTPAHILEQNCKSQNFLQNLHFPATKKQDLSKVEILVLGATEYGNGQNCHFKVLKCYWRSWFKNIGIKNFNSENFYLQNEAASENKIRIEQFLEIKSPLPKKDAICGSQSGAEIVYSPTKEVLPAPTTLIQKTLKPYHLFQTYILRMREANQLYTEIMQNIENNSYSKNLQLIGKRIVVLKELLTLTEELKNHSYCKENNLSETYAAENQKIKQSLYEDEKTFKELSLFK